MEQPKSADATTVKQEDDFLASIRIDQTFANDSIGVRKVLLTVPVRKPAKTEFFRVHPTYMVDCLAIELKTERETYFIKQEIAPSLAAFVEPVRLRLCITRQGVVFLWPLKLPKDDRRADAWRQSAAEAADLGVDRWVQVAADMALGAYQPRVAIADLGNPNWPDEPWGKIVEIALRDRLIVNPAHAVVRQLLGEV